MIEGQPVMGTENRSEETESGLRAALKKGVTAEGLLSGSEVRGCGGDSRN